jgi:sugar lactone lactonase YvrE
MPDIRILARDLGFPEGPVWMADGSVILGEISGRKVTRVAPDGSKSEIGKAGGGRRPLCLQQRRRRLSDDAELPVDRSGARLQGWLDPAH